MEVKHKKSTNAHRGIITRNIFKLKTLLTRKKKNFMEKSLSCFQFSHQKYFLTELIFPQLKGRSKQKIKAQVHSKRQQASQHLISITGNEWRKQWPLGDLGPRGQSTPRPPALSPRKSIPQGTENPREAVTSTA